MDDLIIWEMFDLKYQWYAKDEDGVQYIFECEPSECFSGEYWKRTGGDYIVLEGMTNLTPDIPWNQSKRRRPEIIMKLSTDNWFKISECLPNIEKYQRVLIYTEGYEFDGVQYFDVESWTLYKHEYQHPDDQPEECQLATHWTPRQFD
jgi:hypothetical protein